MSEQTNNDGGPAFPFKCQGQTTAPEIYYGMTLRDYFAAAALPGIKLQAIGPITDSEDLQNVSQQLAVGAYAIADAMLAQRLKASYWTVERCV